MAHSVEFEICQQNSLNVSKLVLSMSNILHFENNNINQATKAINADGNRDIHQTYVKWTEKMFIKY